MRYSPNNGYVFWPVWHAEQCRRLLGVLWIEDGPHPRWCQADKPCFTYTGNVPSQVFKAREVLVLHEAKTFIINPVPDDFDQAHDDRTVEAPHQLALQLTGILHAGDPITAGHAPATVYPHRSPPGSARSLDENSVCLLEGRAGKRRAFGDPVRWGDFLGAHAAVCGPARALSVTTILGTVT